MLSSFHLLIALVLLGLGVLFYFISRKSPEKPQVGDDLDPFEDVKAEPTKPTKTTLVVADEPVTDLEPEVIVTPSKPEPENEDEPVKPTPATTPAKPLVPEKPKPTPIPVVFKPEPVRPAVEEPEQPTPSKTPAKPLVPEKPTAPIKLPAPEPEEPEEPTPTTTPAKPLVPPKPVKPDPEFRMGWPGGTKWNIKGATGNDAQKCNDNCKSLGYNYFTHNPPPADGGCGCSYSGLKLSQLNITDHVNAKTRRVV